MQGTRTDFQPIVTTFVLVGDEEKPCRRYGKRPGRGNVRRRAIVASLAGAR